MEHYLLSLATSVHYPSEQKTLDFAYISFFGSDIKLLGMLESVLGG